MNQKTNEAVAQLKEIVAKYDENLCTKASKHDINAIDNKLRKYVLKDTYDEFTQTTEKGYNSFKVDLDHAV